MNDANLFKEALADAKARRQTELYWCKCGSGCNCDHCKAEKYRVSIVQVHEACRDERITRLLDTGKFKMRNQRHVLTKKTLASLLRRIAKDLDSDTKSWYD